MGRPQFFSLEERVRDLESAQASLSAITPQSVEDLRLRVDRMLEQARSSVQQAQASNTGNASAHLGGEPEAQSEPSLPEDYIDFFDDPEFDPRFQSITSAHPVSFTPPIPENISMNPGPQSSDIRLRYDGRQLSPYNNMHTMGSSRPYASGALQHPLDDPLEHANARVTASLDRRTRLSGREEPEEQVGEDFPPSPQPLGLRGGPYVPATPLLSHHLQSSNGHSRFGAYLLPALLNSNSASGQPTDQSFYVPRRPGEEEISMSALTHHSRTQLGRGRRVRRSRVRHQGNSTSTLQLRNSQLRESNRVTRDGAGAHSWLSITPPTPADPHPGYQVTYSSERDQLLPGDAALDNPDNESMPPLLSPSPQFHPVGNNDEIHINNRWAPELRGPPIRNPGGRRAPSRADIADLQGPIAQHIEDIRHHRLPRYYELMESYSHILHRWCLQVHDRISAGAQGLQIPADQLARMPTIRSVFQDIGQHFRSQNVDQIALAVQGIVDFLEPPSFLQIYQSVREIPVVREFAELLLEQGMEEERMVWEPVIHLHTGLRLNAILFMTQEENTRAVLNEDSESGAELPGEHNTADENEADAKLLFPDILSHRSSLDSP